MPAQLERDQHPSVFSFLDFMDHAGLWLMQDTIHRVCENANTSNRVAAYLRTLTKALQDIARWTLIRLRWAFSRLCAGWRIGDWLAKAGIGEKSMNPLRCAMQGSCFSAEKTVLSTLSMQACIEVVIGVSVCKHLSLVVRWTH